MSNVNNEDLKNFRLVPHMFIFSKPAKEAAQHQMSYHLLSNNIFFSN